MAAKPPHDPALDAAVDRLLAHAGGRLVLAAPLGLGKPHRVLNAITRRVADDPQASLHLLTARQTASSAPPRARSTSIADVAARTRAGSADRSWRPCA